MTMAKVINLRESQQKTIKCLLEDLPKRLENAKTVAVVYRDEDEEVFCVMGSVDQDYTLAEVFLDFAIVQDEIKDFSWGSE